MPLLFLHGKDYLKLVPKGQLIDIVFMEIKNCWSLAYIMVKTDWNIKKCLEKLLATRDALVKKLKVKKD